VLEDGTSEEVSPSSEIMADRKPQDYENDQYNSQQRKSDLGFMRHTKSSIVKEKTKQELEADLQRKKKESKKNMMIGGPKTFSIELVDPPTPD
jgi:hypothetical protein